MMKFRMDSSWEQYLQAEFEKDYFKNLTQFLNEEYASKKIYPPAKDIFSAFNFSKFEDTKVIIIGQDPYHQEGQAHGLAFSVSESTLVPPSLKNIFKEIENDLGHPSCVKNGHLGPWAQQGVLLLNSILTVEDSSPMSHQNRGWENFTDKVIEILNQQKNNLVFLLWGKPAEVKAKKVDRNRHLVLTSSHPSPLSSYRGFLGCRHFSKCNEYLEATGQKKILW